MPILPNTSPNPTSFPAPPRDVPLVDATGNITPIWYRYLLSLFLRTGGAAGGNIIDVQALATLAESNEDAPAVRDLLLAALPTVTSQEPPARDSLFLALPTSPDTTRVDQLLMMMLAINTDPEPSLISSGNGGGMSTDLIFSGSSTTIFGNPVFLSTSPTAISVGDTYSFNATMDGYTGSQDVAFYLINDGQTEGYTWVYQLDANLVLSVYDGSFHVLRNTGSGQFSAIPNYVTISGTFTIGASANYIAFESAGSLAPVGDSRVLFSTDIYFGIVAASASNIKKCFITKLSP